MCLSVSETGWLWCMHLFMCVCVCVRVCVSEQDCVFSDKTMCATCLMSTGVRSWRSLSVTAVQKSGGWGWLSTAEPLILSIINTLLVQSVFQSNSLWILHQCLAEGYSEGYTGLYRVSLFRHVGQKSTDLESIFTCTCTNCIIKERLKLIVMFNVGRQHL